MEVYKLTGKDCLSTRELWEMVFSEDSVHFVDYYYKEKAHLNHAYVTGTVPYLSMMFCTPYEISVYDKVREVPYIVGVATRKENRHQGRMTAMMMTAMGELYQKKVPFAFLMPADPAIYAPFDFTYIYERPQWIFSDPEFPEKILEPLMGTEHTLEVEGGFLLHSMTGQRENEKAYLEQLAVYANRRLESQYKIYAVRNKEYYDRQLKELWAQNGDIFFLEKEGKMAGFFLYAREAEEIFVQEMMETLPKSFPFLQERKEKKPVIMARLIHLEEMMKLVRSPQNRSLLIQVEDPLLHQNEGVYLWEITPYGSRVTRQSQEKRPEVSIHIKELTGHLLKEVFLNEIV